MSRFRGEAHSAVSRMCWRAIPPSNSGGSTFRRRVLTHAPASGWLKKAVSRRDRGAVNETPTATVGRYGGARRQCAQATHLLASERSVDSREFVVLVLAHRSGPAKRSRVPSSYTKKNATLEANTP